MFIEKIEWNEAKTRPPTEEERADWRKQYGVELQRVIEGTLPKDGEQILVASKYGVRVDKCFIRGESVYLGCRGAWQNVYAWAKWPKYKGKEDE